MAFPLDDFEQYIPDPILARGRSYFESGAVLWLDEKQAGEYVADVEGNDTYEVHVSVRKRYVVAESCNCPYDDGICKHVVAVLYAIREDLEIEMESEEEDAPSQSSEVEAKPKKVTLTSRLDKVLQDMTLEQLRAVLRQHCLDDDCLCRNLLLEYEQDRQPVNKAEITAQVNRMLRKAAGRNGYIDYYNAGDAAAMVGEVLMQAEKSLALGRPLDALVMASVVMEEMTDALQFADDSDGEIGGIIDDALEVIRGIAAMDPLDENARKEAFAYCCRAYQERRYEQWDWHLPMLSLAGAFARNAAEKAAVMSLAEQAPRSEYSLQGQREVAFELIRKFQGDAAADEYLQAHIEVNSFRKLLIERSLAAGDAERADKLAEEGYLQDNAKSPGYAYHWLKLRLQIAEQQQDSYKAVLLARQLFDESYHDKMDAFRAIKRNIPKPEWPAYLEALIVKVQSSATNQRDLLAEIYVSEGMHDKLLVIVQQVRQPHFTTQYQSILKAKHSEPLVQVWKSILENYFHHCTDRRAYAIACGYLKQIKSLGGVEVANRLAVQIRAEFAKRPAFLDELRRAGF